MPRSLSNCKHLKILDIGNNKMGGTFPSWLFTLGELEVLVLRSNRLYGPVSGRSTSHPFPKLRILDLSNNQFTGYLPIQYFKNMKPAADNAYSYKNKSQGLINYSYEASISLNVKGTEYEVKNILHIYTTIDLSYNKFQGEVPKVTGELKWLALLNLSHNSLTGHMFCIIIMLSSIFSNISQYVFSKNSQALEHLDRFFRSQDAQVIMAMHKNAQQ